MKKYLIGYSFGFAGDNTQYVIEAESLEEAEREAWEAACERVSSWAEEVLEGGEDE